MGVPSSVISLTVMVSKHFLERYILDRIERHVFHAVKYLVARCPADDAQQWYFRVADENLFQNVTVHVRALQVSGQTYCHGHVQL